MSNDKKRGFSAMSGQTTTYQPSFKAMRGQEYIYDSGRQSGGKLQHQVKYGPGVGFTSAEKGKLHGHYGTHAVTSRYTQYNSDRSTYVNAATNNGRGLTLQELDVQKGRSPGPTSINHIIASGSGQHALNRATLEFMGGRKTANELSAPLTQKFQGIAQQAAAEGRMRSLGREILREESRTEGYGGTFRAAPSLTEHQGFVEKRNHMAKDLHSAFEKGHVDSYKRFLKHTFDSTGNLRLGQSSGNSRVSTGFDMPLDPGLNPTQRGKNLLQAYKSFGYQDMQQETALTKRNNSGLFTTNQSGSKLSSSKQVAPDSVSYRRRFSGK